VIPICLPKVGQKFRNLDDAWLFWVNYGGHAGFEVRKRSSWTSKMDGKVTSCRYVCAKEGRRAQDKRDHRFGIVTTGVMEIFSNPVERGV
jgi:zinc finger SWIM domain-containing protein 3